MFILFLFVYKKCIFEADLKSGLQLSFMRGAY